MKDVAVKLKNYEHRIRQSSLADSMFDVQKNFYSAVQYFLFDTIVYIYSRRNGQTF